MQTLQRKKSMYRQTKVLLWKNVLIKWRMKKKSFQEWILSLLFLLLVYLITLYHYSPPIAEIPHTFLGRLDDPAFNATGVTVAYTPVTNTTRQIMNKVAFDSVMKGIKTEAVEDEKALEMAWTKNQSIVGVVFEDDFSYRLRFAPRYVVIPNENLGDIDSCYNASASYCESPRYWYNGFVSLQSSIDAAIIEGTTSHSVWEEMKSIAGVRMRSLNIMPTITMDYSFILITLVMCFSPFMHFLALNMTSEKRKHKELMKMMGLQDLAFWLSWSLLYAVNISIMSCALTAIFFSEFFLMSSFSAVWLLFFLYGISSIHFIFLLSSLLKKHKTTANVGFLLTLLFGFLSLIVLLTKLPAPLEWALGLLCPFAFNAGFAKIFHLEKYGIGFSFSNLMEESNFLLKTYIILILDAILYMMLAIYFDKVLPDKYGIPYPPLFFLKSSYWSKSRRDYPGERPEIEQNRERIFNDNVERIPPDFVGKEAIRLNNIKKIYGKNDQKAEALRGLFLNIYEGQTTALLGHSGAGKTTLLNVLSGFIKASDGSATIYNYHLSEIGDRERIRERIGFCPQFNIQFEVVTVKENLQIFAGIKGIQSSEAEREVQNILTLLDMTSIQDIQADKLSGGQKRKLSLGIAMLGDPQVLLLDEPTAGLDPCSRHQVWTLLKERKSGRVTLFSTQFMDEADILADRKAFISCGRIKCVGSSLFLKKKWGIGYRLRMHVNEHCDSERMSSLVREYVPNATFSGQSENELRYILPMENVDKFPDLFFGLDSHSDEGIVNYGVTMTTLEDVFMKLEGEDQEGDGQAEEERETFSADEVEEGLLSFSDMGKATVTGTTLWKQQVRAIARMRFLKLKTAYKTLWTLLLLYLIFVLPLILELVLTEVWQVLNSWELTSALYFLPVGKKADKEYLSLLVLNETGSSIENFVHAVEKQKIMLDVTTGKNITEELIHNGAIKVSCEDESYRFTIMCHMEVINCFPMLVNIISNALLGTLNSTEHIRIWNHPFFFKHRVMFWNNIIMKYLVFWLIIYPAFPPYFATSHIEDYKRKAHSQLRISGLIPSAYWCGQALVDIPLNWILLISMSGILLSQNSHIWKHSGTLLFLLIGLIGSGAAIVLFLYLIAFIFRKGCSSHILSLTLVMVTFAVHLLGLFMFSIEDRITHYVLSIFLPMYPLFGLCITTLYVFVDFPDSHLKPNWPEILISVFGPYIQCVAFVFLLRYLEMKYGKAVLREDPIFRLSPGKEPCHQNPDEPEEEDEDVQAERERVRQAIASQNQKEKPVVMVNNLRKEYKVKKASAVFKKKKKVATKNVSFCVRRGEVLGLLGPNGAGKSTTINMITGETVLSAGQVLAKGKDAVGSQLEARGPGFLGYCPQGNPLWPTLTVQEHLEVYAAVKGLRKKDAAVAIDRMVKALELQEHLKKETRTLSAGITRKLCFILSMLGNPTVMLLDEPSTGMDPKGQRQVWKAIHAALKNKEQGAILTTHYMEEAEAVCDRVAIMVAGELRCIGSIQYLKSKFGKGYLLEIKVKDAEQVDELHAKILTIFPQAARQERIPSLLVYKIPMEDALPLSQAFSKLEAAKQTLGFEEYSFSLNTLMQVFLELSREQEKENFDLALDGNYEWKQLQPQDI
ncbi:PREDICTED: ATP-binding cassette sub-family A member 10-like [Crocodylus porosus]|uniref:ATP-binding cassette sub-family A member 10-like n=1 Tax=Crocodylus porosus TaxID=8502 RepID=UPI00093BF2B9|nr:PREDICTED: ATP-binding cassette sub-family A member 10-like [Crocodylus porosus]XP_019397889.1 PREDICTED: ATP-binding cassette sub-family A member 10-like [Crocodylus porosus]XP_019397890.1 PREDICTED: ATP-binding cassette sub-family A member 10-like [Crocodylus porosus]